MRIIPPRLFALCAAAMLALWSFVQGGPAVDAAFRPLGWIPLVLGLTLTLAGARLFDGRKTNIKTFNEPTILVTDGLFRWSRNPMYLGFVVAQFGLALVFGGIGQFIIAALFFLAAALWYIPFEEAAMRTKFGQAYADYAARTRRWL